MLNVGFGFLEQEMRFEVLSKLTKIDIWQMTEIPFCYPIGFEQFPRILKSIKNYQTSETAIENAVKVIQTTIRNILSENGFAIFSLDIGYVT